MKKFKGLGWIVMLAVALLLTVAGSNKKAFAAGSVEVTEINYNTSSMVIRLGSSDSALMISDSKQKKWDYIPVEKEAGNLVTLDISWISVAKDYTLSLKGDVSSTPVKVVLPKQKKDMKVTYSTQNGGTLTFTGVTGSVEWKKRDAVSWERFPVDASGKPDTAAFADTLRGMNNNGCVLMFREAAVNGSSVTNVGKRSSKEIIISVAKKLPAPQITLDDSKMTVSVTKDMEYRLCDENGNPGNDPKWTSFGKTYNCPVSEIASSALIDAKNTPQDVYVQFRTAATSSKQMSNISTICIPAQEDLSTTAKTDIKLVYTSTSTFRIEVPVASSSEPYEYCIINQKAVDEGITIDDVDEIKWKPITTSTPITISESKDNVKNTSLVYVRRKALKKLGEEGYKLASPEMFLGEVSYPKDITTLSGLTWLQTVAGECSAENSQGKLSFTFYSETNSAIKSLKFVDFSSTGTVREILKVDEDFTSIVTENADYDASEEDETKAEHYRYIISTSIFSTKKLDKYAEDSSQRRMLAYISIGTGDSEEFKSDTTKGIALYIHPATKVNNPSTAVEKKNIADKLGWTDYNEDADEIEYSSAFERVYGSNRIYKLNNGYPEYMSKAQCDATSFRVRLDIGTRYIPKSGTAGELTNDKVEVTKIRYDGVEFAKGAKDSSGNSYFTVEYADTTGSSAGNSGDQQRMAVLTINVAAMEKNAQIDDRDKATNLIIYLSNGEVIREGITINLKNTAVIVDYENKTKGAQSLTLNERLLLKDIQTVSDGNGGEKITETDHPNDHHIRLQKFKADYNLSLMNVTWKDKQVCTKIASQSEYITMDISNRMINEIYNSVTPGTSESAYLVFEFDNGFRITSGWKITINRPASDIENK
ncbi:MAG: hypothetical protein MJ131_03895 [Lachnospiraceae bacterium]|nr:hypothetical protein [Lachnospiraceae bacterium]